MIQLEGWDRTLYGDELEIPWVAPSPNCASLHTAFAYVGTCVFEGTNISEGRGTTMPFEYIGAPWIDADSLAGRMCARDLPGLYFRPASFTPAASKYAGEPCRGVQVHITDRSAADVIEGALTLLDEIRALYPDRLEFISNVPGTWFIDKLLGTDAYRLGQYDAHALLEAHRPAREAFIEARKPFLLYQ